MSKQIYIGLGSNLSHPEQQIKQALEALSQLPQTTLLKQSSLYLSKALTLPDSPAQNDYINAVVQLDSALNAQRLLQQLQAIENNQGRVRTAKWGARTLDLDILLFGNDIIDTETLIIPHSQIVYRNFVIHPLFEIAGDINIPGIGSLAQLAEQTNWEGLDKYHQ